MLAQVPVLEPAVQRMTGALGRPKTLFPAADQPRVAEGVGIGETRSVPGHEVVVLLVIVVAAKTAELVLVRGRHGHLHIVVAVPDHLDAFVYSHNDVVVLLVDAKDLQHHVRKLDAFFLYPYAEELSQLDFHVPDFDDNGFGPGKRLGVPDIVPHFNGKCAADAVRRQHIAAWSLVVEHLSIKCSVVWISVHGANAVLLHAGGAAFARRGDELLFRGAHGGRDALFNAAADHAVVTGARGALLQLPRFPVVALLVVIVAHGFLLLRLAALGTAAVRAGLLVFWGALQRRAHCPLADDRPVLALAVGALVVGPCRLVVVDVTSHATLSVHVVEPLTTAAFGAACAWRLGDAARWARQHRAGLLRACDSPVLAEADDARVPLVRGYGVSFGVLSAAHSATFAVWAALPLRWISRILAVDVAVDPGLCDHTGLAEKSATRVLRVAPFLGAGVDSALVDTAFADVAALVPLGLLQEVAAPW